jgi:hypothetical protein
MEKTARSAFPRRLRPGSRPVRDATLVAFGLGLAFASPTAWAQEVYIEIDAKPIAEAPPTGSGAAATSAARVEVAIAPVRDATGMFQTPSDREIIDSALEAALSGGQGTGSASIRLPSSGEPCDRGCELVRARGAGARFLVAAETRLFAGAYLATIDIVRVADGGTARTLQTDPVAEPVALLGALKRSAAELRTALDALLGHEPSTPAASSAPVPRLPASSARPVDVAASDAQAVDFDRIQTYRSRRAAGVVFFVLGVLTTVAGGVVLGVGEFEAGISIAVAGDLMWIPGLVAMTVNSVRVHKLENGMPLGSSLRLEGLSPVVASRERAAPGLVAAFSF